MARGKLNTEAKTFVVTSLACFDPPKTIQDALKASYGAEISLQGIEAYDPYKHAGRNVSERWRTIFAETRKAFLEDTSQIGISHKTVRLRALNRMADKAEGMGNMALAAQLHEQAAKECGGSYTNKHSHEHTGKDGGPIETANLSAEERQKRLDELIQKRGG